MKQNKKFMILLISILIIAIILFALWHFKIFPFNEEQFKLDDETCFKTCININKQPYVKTSLLEEPSSTLVTPVIEIPLAPKMNNVEIPLAPTKTTTGAIPTPPILNTPSTNLNIKSPISESSNPLLEQIRQGIQLKPTSPIQIQKTSSNPLLEQIRQGIQLKPTSPIQKEDSAKSSTVVTPSLQDEIAKRLASRRSLIEDEDDSFDELFRYLRYGY